MEFESSLLEGFRQRYKSIHPLIFWRSLEKAKTAGELFDILEGVPVRYPIVWSEEKRCWIESEAI